MLLGGSLQESVLKLIYPSLLIPLIRIEACVLKKMVINLKESSEAVQIKKYKSNK
ncbi:hypothetical protein Gohar_000814 [Gossypium harknessii]|uniref:Uncharacterized protein n=1 Tax=Gossypium harknessii TaxID=34285 RepID=A0A7J9I2L3_9ROSI|nr:hypothetical protein [Gossypium harknessii]